MGGLPRRATFISRQRENGPDALLLDSGNFVSDRPLLEPALEPAGAKAALILEAMDRMGYDAVAVGEMELSLGSDRLMALREGASVPFLSANLTDGEGKPLFLPQVTLEAGGLTVGVFGLTGRPADPGVLARRMGGAVVGDPVEAAREAVKQLRGSCDLVVLLSNIGFNRDLELAREVPGIDVIISGRTRRFMRRPLKEDKTLVTTGYYEGRAVGKLVIHYDGNVQGWISREELQFLDGQVTAARARTSTNPGKRRYEELLKDREDAAGLTVYEADMVNLEPSMPDDQAVAGMIREYRRGLAAAGPGSPVQAPRGQPATRYTGSKACSGCHESRYRFWAGTGHAEAFEALAPKEAGADPDCLPCHVTGYMRRTGYSPDSPREELRGVGCEACHGVGSLHTRWPDRYGLLHLPSAPQCLDCHTEEQDDDFDYFRDRSLICAEAL